MQVIARYRRRRLFRFVSCRLLRLRLLLLLGLGPGVTGGRIFANMPFNCVSNFVASSAEENSIATSTSGTSGNVGQAPIIMREVMS